EENPASFWAMVGLNYFLAATYGSIEAFQILYGKDRLRRKEVPLDFAPSTYSVSEYEAVMDYMDPLEELIRSTPPDSNGLCWRYLDRSVLFEFSRVIPAPYTDFVRRVDISKAVQSMNDNIGGACVTVARDALGRVTHQAERNIYLPQPNYMALYGGGFIDVG